ncbi:MAG: Gfo/Idh/MocA family oxidoreductase [Deltaproteobacteria bacterium]|nr:Gfo/Idh/MocA family oxidoreductase [Deltaproteobacteria bacterium]
MRPIRTGLIGCGHWGERLARNLAALPSFRLETVCDLDPARAWAVAVGYDVERSTVDAATLLRDGTLEAVVLATPASSHVGLAAAALEAGLHVLCEKPLALSAAAGAELHERARRSGRVLLTDHTELHSGTFRALADRVVLGTLGDVRKVRLVHENAGTGPWDLDLLWDLAPHDFAILEALGAGEATAVELRDSNGGSPDGPLALALRTAAGWEVELRLRRGAPERRRELEVRGTRGAVRAGGFAPGEPVLGRDGGADEWTAVEAVEPTEPLRRLCETFAARIRGELPPGGNGAGEVRILQAIEAAARAWHRR